MSITCHLGRYKVLTLAASVGLISVALLVFTSAPSLGETIIGTAGKPGAVGTAYNYVDVDYSDQFTEDGLLDWPSTLAYRAGKGTSQYDNPQVVRLPTRSSGSTGGNEVDRVEEGLGKPGQDEAVRPDS